MAVSWLCHSVIFRKMIYGAEFRQLLLPGVTNTKLLLWNLYFVGVYLSLEFGKKQTSSEKRDKCNVTVFPNRSTYICMKVEVIGLLETSTVVCRLHDTAIQKTRIFIFTTMKTKYPTQKWNEFDFQDKTNGFKVYCQLLQGTQKARGKGKLSGYPHEHLWLPSLSVAMS